jgi:GT2 family glycosyltransferase
MTEPAVTLCIINYNGAAHLPRALDAVRRQSWSFAEVLVVDNASADGSAARARELCPCVKVLQLPENRGPGAARNAGFAAARHDMILFQDNDVRLQTDTAALLLEEMRAHAGTFVVAPRVLYSAEPDRIQFDSADCHFLGLMATRNADAPAACSAAAAETTSLVTACFLVDRSRWPHGPPFDENLGFNLEDHDFGVRAVLRGKRLRVQPRATVLHGGGTPGISYRPGDRPAEDRQFYLVRNRWIIIAKCYAPRTLALLAPALLAFELFQLAWLTAERRPRVWGRAAASVWRARRRLREERRAVQQERRVHDGSVLRDAVLPLTRHVRDSRAAALALPAIDHVFRAYWRLVRRWLER